jgi:uncharacterized repeat protein (TIGR03943 family)
MNRLGRATILLCLGVIVVRLLWSGGFGWFVQQRMAIPLGLAAAVLLIFGIYEAVIATGDDRRGDGGGRRRSAPAVGWLLVVPVFVLVAVAPTGLGAAAADRVDAYRPVDTGLRYEPLDASTGPVPMKMIDFLDRALWDGDNTLDSVTIRLEGLVVNDPSVPDGFKLTRFMVSCCAADAVPLQINLRDVAQPLPDDTWVVADVVWKPAPDRDVTQPTDDPIEATAVTITPQASSPDDPYESPF